MVKPGRKSKAEELQVIRRYQDLAPKFFAVLTEFLNSEKKEDKKWAVEQLSKAYPKMIPQQVTGEGGGPIEVQWLSKSPTPLGAGLKSSTTA